MRLTARTLALLSVSALAGGQWGPSLTSPPPPCAANITCAVSAAGWLYVDQCGAGFHATDSRGMPDHTCVIQAALNASSAHSVVLRNLSQSRPWVANPLRLRRSNMRLLLADGAFLLAKRDYRDASGSPVCQSSTMLDLANVSNVSIVGEGGGPLGKPTIRGWKWDHVNNTFSCGGRDRMGFSLHSGGMLTHDNVTYQHPKNWREYTDFGWCHNISLTNLTIELSGGDGIYLEGCSGVHLADLNVTGAGSRCHASGARPPLLTSALSLGRSPAAGHVRDRDERSAGRAQRVLSDVGRRAVGWHRPGAGRADTAARQHHDSAVRLQ